MGVQVIKQPDGQLALFSDETSRWLRWNMSGGGVVEWFAAQAAAGARQSYQAVVERVLAGEPQHGYAETFAEANAYSQHSGGEVLAGPVDPALLAELERPLGALDFS